MLISNANYNNDMMEKMSRNEMRIMVILFKNEGFNTTNIQKRLKPKIKGSIPAYAGVCNNVNKLIKLGLVKRVKGKALYLTENGKYYAELLYKLNRRQKR